MMKRLVFLYFCLLISFQLISAQDTIKKFEPSGKPLATVFFNYHYDFTKDAQKKSQFELQRSYLGYGYNFSEQFSTRVLVDVGYDESVDSKGKVSTSFTAFLKIASLEWKMNKMFGIEAGMIATHTFDLQEKFYGYRYILETLIDKEKYYSSADLGIKATFIPTEKLEFHAGIYNGEGYKKIQDSYGLQKASFDVVIRPVKGLVFKTYYDFNAKKDTANGEVIELPKMQLLNFFLGYEKKDMFRIGAEYVINLDNQNVENHHINGLSAYGTYILKKFELFGRYDQTVSNTLNGTTNPWNNSKDYSLILGGIQYAPVKGVKMALNYRHYTPRDSNLNDMDFVYLNFEYKF